MLSATKERTRLTFPQGVIDELVSTHKLLEDTRDRIRKLEPICPDGSGEIGKYDQAAFDYLGGIAVYKTDSGKRFLWVDTVKKGKLLDPNRYHFDEVLKR